MKQKQCASKAIAPSTTKKTKVASKAPGDPENHPPHLPLQLKQRQQHHHRNLSVRGKQTMTNKTVTTLMRTSAVCFQTYEDDVVEDTGLDWLQCAQEMAA